MMSIFKTYLLSILTFTLIPNIVFASQGPDEEEFLFEEVIVTSLRATQGGVQDIKHFRNEVASGRMPHPADLTSEGLLSEYDILITSDTPCQQLFCLSGETMRSDLLVPSNDLYFVGIGFNTNLDGKEWQRAPLNLIAVVDKSGSMDGTPLELVRQSLAEILSHMGPDDHLTIILYGDDTYVHLPTIQTSDKNRALVLSSIKEIESAGSTNMESGLRLGYKTAGETSVEFEGTTRVMLFTDERPNVGNTDANTFMAMAVAASNAGVGLTTIGVGVQFDSQLATTISSIRGGNLFFIRDENDIATLFKTDFDFMVSELAYDLKMSVTPLEGYKVSAVYGVPNQMLGWQDDKTVELNISTVFLSSKGGGIFLTLSPDEKTQFLPAKSIGNDTNLASVKLTYKTSQSKGKEKDSLVIQGPGTKPSEGLKLAHLLIDEFTSLYHAATAHHIKNDQETAFQTVRAFSQRISSIHDKKLEEEKSMFSQLEARLAFLSGHASEGYADSNFAKLWGAWKVRKVDGDTDVKKHDVFTFTEDNEFSLFRREEEGYNEEEREEYQATNDQIYFESSEIQFDYKVKKDRLTLTHKKTGVMISLKKTDSPKNMN